MTEEIRELRSFGRYEAGRSRVFRPTNITEVKDCFGIARTGKLRVTIRGGGHSFHSQALHEGDTGNQMIVSSEAFEPERIEFDPTRHERVTLGCGVRWRRFVEEAIHHARQNNMPICLPGSMQTGGDTTVGGTLAGDCLSRFSGTLGKESRWIDSFRILTPNGLDPINVSKASHPDLFHAVIGGHGYIGFVTDITLILTPIDKNLGMDNGGFKQLCAHTKVTAHTSLSELIQKQEKLLGEHQEFNKSRPGYPRAVSAEWLGACCADPGDIHGAVCDSFFAEPSSPKLPGFPLYHDLHSKLRYLTEVVVRYRLGDVLVGWVLYLWIRFIRQQFEDPVADFLFFMDGDTAARKRFEESNRPRLFPLVQQTFVVPIKETLKFTINCIRKIREHKLHPTECDMLFVPEDECLLSANYRLNGFAISFAFEQPGDKPPERVFALLRELSKDCLSAGGRIHLPKNSHIDREVFRLMFHGQIQQFERIKKQYDPDLLLQNPFSDRLFDFQ